jgi:hypothetical protein
MIHACIKHMNDCVKRIEQLKSLKIDSAFEDQIKPLIAREIEDCINEYLRTYKYLSEKLEKSKDTSIKTTIDIKENLDNKGITFEILMKLLQRNGVINEKGSLTEKGSKLLDEEAGEKDLSIIKTDLTSIDEPKDIDKETDFVLFEEIKSVEKEVEKDQFQTSNGWKLFENSNAEKWGPSEEDIFQEQIDSLKQLKKEINGLDLGKRSDERDSITLEDELRYLMERPKKEGITTEREVVICPNCLSKVSLIETCSVCNYRLIPSESMGLDEETQGMELDSDLNQRTFPFEISEEHIKHKTNEKEKDFQKRHNVQNYTVKNQNNKSDTLKLIGGFVSYFAITIGIILLSGSLFIFLLTINNLTENALQLTNLLLTIIDTFPGVPFSSNILLSLNYWARISVIFIFGIVITLIGTGLWRNYQKAKITGAIIFIFASLIDVYNILIINVSKALMPFYSLVINIVVVYLIIYKLTLTKIR